MTTNSRGCSCHGMSRHSLGYANAHGRGGPREAVNSYAYDGVNSDKAFRAACERVHIQPSRRQYRRWCNEKGAAYAGRAS